MALLAIQDLIANAKKEAAYAAAAGGGDTFAPSSLDGKLLLHFKNTNAAARNVTINDVNSVAPAGATAFNPDVVITVDATDEAFVELTNLERFKDAATGLVSLTYDAVAGLTLAILRVV